MRRRHAAVTGARQPRPVSLRLVVPLLAVAVAGVGVMLYPSAARWVTAIQESDQVQQYTEQVSQIPPPKRDKEIRAAQAYNAELAGGAISGAFSSRPTGTGGIADHQRYESLLSPSPGAPMARLQIPSINVDLPIYHGTSDHTLDHGIGHIEGTALPVGGPGTHAVLTGHRGLPQSVLFTNLNKVKVGDRFDIEVYGETLNYTVVTVTVVDPDQTETLYPVPGRDLVTLVTCTPLGINSQRILVTGQRLLDATTAHPLGKPTMRAGFPWWAVWFGLAVMAATAYTAGIARGNRRLRASPLVSADEPPATATDPLSG